MCVLHTQSALCICRFCYLWIRPTVDQTYSKKKKKKKIPESLKNQNLSLPRAQHYTEFMQMK